MPANTTAFWACCWAWRPCRRSAAEASIRHRRDRLQRRGRRSLPCTFSGQPGGLRPVRSQASEPPGCARRLDGPGVSRRSGSTRSESPRRPIPADASAAIWRCTSSKGRCSRASGVPVGVVQAIAGQSRLWARFQGRAGHAGTLPMPGRRDALAAAAELVLEVERLRSETPGASSHRRHVSVEPGAVNVVPGTARLCVDVRHAHDESRTAAVAEIRGRAAATGRAPRGRIRRSWKKSIIAAVPLIRVSADLLGAAVAATGQPLHQTAERRRPRCGA